MEDITAYILVGTGLLVFIIRSYKTNKILERIADSLEEIEEKKLR